MAKAAARTAKDLAAAQARKVTRLERQAKRAFEERDELLIALSKIWPAHLMPTKAAALIAGTNEDWLWSLCLHSPVGQLAWSLNNDLAARFSHLDRHEHNEWDGHTAEERSNRLARLPPRVHS